MKTRIDFVSNSSNCSFFVGLHTIEDVKVFVEKILPILKKKNTFMKLFSSFAAAKARADIGAFDGNVENIRPGKCMLCICSDDNDENAHDIYKDIESLFISGSHKFKLYADEFAHTTVDDPLPEDNLIDRFFNENWD